MTNILIPVGGSPASLRAVDYAIAQYPEASFVLLNVQNLGATELAGELMYSDWKELIEQAAAKALREATAKSEAANIRFETFVRMGATAETIAQVAREKSVDHIVMGTRGLGSIQGLLMGSVATKVIHLAEVPVTLIK
jgi:nucleotide-binding universal stress UspA family protein